MTIQEFHARLRTLPCVVCFHMGMPGRCEELHHAGNATDRSDWNVVPLCNEHHRGPNGIHGLHRRGFEMRYKLTDYDLIATTREAYSRMYE